jgi:hypothetical protein
MQKINNYLLPCILLLFLQVNSIQAQISAGSATIALHTANPVLDIGKTQDDIIEMNMTNLYDLQKIDAGIRSGGVIADNFGATGFVTVSVYLYDRTKSRGHGPLIYECTSTQASTGFLEQSTGTQRKTDRFNYTQDVQNTDIVKLLALNNIYKTTCTKYTEVQGEQRDAGFPASTTTSQTSAMSIALKAGSACGSRSPGGPLVRMGAGLSCFSLALKAGEQISYDLPTLLNDPQPPHVEQRDFSCVSDYLPIQPVAIEVSVKNATLRKIKIPAIGEVDVNDLFNVPGTFRVTVSINGVNQPAITYPSSTVPTYNLTMGDSIGVNVEIDKNMVPEIFGATQVWPAAFAGDLMFHCDPNKQPGGYAPFIGLDSRVHTLMLRPYPSNFQVKNLDWNPKGTLQSGMYQYQWGWTADRQTDANKTIYTPSLLWPKCHLNPTRNADGSYNLNACKAMGSDFWGNVYQRQDQKEGLNIQYLTYFNNWFYSTFQNYDGNIKYMKGFDDDELAYFNIQTPVAAGNSAIVAPCTTSGCQNTMGITKLDNLPWKSMPEGEIPTVDNNTGFPSQYGSAALNYMVDAYRANKTANRSTYWGYEIQDQATGWNNPDGDGSNVSNPGMITITAGSSNQTIQFKVNVASPLDNENGKPLGFYEALVGQNNPSVAEAGVRYWLRGVANKTNDEIKKYTLVYSWMDRLGKVSEKPLNVFDDVVSVQKYASIPWQTWVNQKETSTLSRWLDWFGWKTGVGFDQERPAYSWITAYYQRTPTSAKVPVAGKEITPIFLMFTGVDSVNGAKFVEGKGQGNRIFLEDYRQAIDGDFNVSKTFGNTTKYSTQYLRDYVFPPNTTLTFTTMDGDPYTFDNDEEEWYLSNRSMAKRVRDYLLDGSFALSITTGKHEAVNLPPDAKQAYLQYYVKKLNDDGSESSGDYVLIGTGAGGSVTGVSNARTWHKNLTCTFSQTGYYALKIVYRNGSDIYHRIKIANYNNPLKGVIAGSRNITPQEARWLNISASQTSSYWVYEVKDVMSKYKYEDGYRAKVSDDRKYDGKPNRWSKFNDYADEYKWYTTTTPSNLQQAEWTSSISQVSTYLANYENVRKQWFWKDWALHYSSNWLSIKNANGAQGLPPYVPETNVVRIKNPADLNSFNSYIGENLFNTAKYANQLKTPWQFTIPLLSYTEYYGIRGRTNPSCIYDLSKVFDRTNGAFSGNPLNPPNPEDIQAPDYGDDYKDQQDFYHDLKYKRKIIVTTSDMQQIITKTLSAYQKDPSSTNTTLVATKSLSTTETALPNAPIIRNNILSADSTQLGDLTMIVYPNPSKKNMNVNIKFSRFVSGDMNITLFDFSNRVVYTSNFIANQTNLYQMKLPANLTAGMYVVSVTVGGTKFSKTLMIEN